MNYYQLDDREIFQTFDTSESGLTEEEARKRLRRYGPNRLAAVLTLLLREYVDAGEGRLSIYLTKADNYLTMALVHNSRVKEDLQDDPDWPA